MQCTGGFHLPVRRVTDLIPVRLWRCFPEDLQSATATGPGRWCCHFFQINNTLGVGRTSHIGLSRDHTIWPYLIIAARSLHRFCIGISCGSGRADLFQVFPFTLPVCSAVYIIPLYTGHLFPLQCDSLCRADYTAKRCSFDPGCRSFCTVSRADAAGDGFDLIGVYARIRRKLCICPRQYIFGNRFYLTPCT